MAVTADISSRKIVMSNNYGMVDGAELIKEKSFNYCKSDATDEALYALAEAIDSINAPTMDSVSRVDSYALAKTA